MTMNIIHAIILGIVEGLTEFLPVSSTAHIELASQVMRLADTDFLKSFTVIIQFGSILPVLFIYLKKYATNLEVHKRVLAGFLPTAIIGFVLYKIIKTLFLGNILLALIMLIIGGIILVVFETLHKEPTEPTMDITKISVKNAFIIGCCQSLAAIPGVSRSAATIVGGMALGISRKTIVEFSFLLAVPTTLAASGYDLLKSGHNFTSEQYGLLAVGFIAALIFAQISITFFLNYIRKHSFKPFGVYRIVIGLLFAGLLLTGLL